MTCFQNVPVDTTTRAVAVVSSAVTVRGEQSATNTPVTALPVNLGGFSHFASNVNPFTLFCFYSSTPTPPPPQIPISTTSRLAVNIDSLSELFATCRMLTSVSGPCTCRNDLPLPLPKKPSPGPFTSNFQAFLFLCYVFPSHAASFLRRKLLLIV